MIIFSFWGRFWIRRR